MAYPDKYNLEVRGFLNLAGFFRRYIKDFGAIATPLYDLTKNSPAKRSPINWSIKAEHAFKRLKNAVTTSPVLRLPDWRYYFVVDTDASGYAIGAILLQYFQEESNYDKPLKELLRTGKAKNLHPIAFESRKLTDTEQRYSAQEREMLAVCHALEHWRSIIEGTRIVVRTDHESLKYFRSTKIMTRRMAKFLDIIETFDPLIIYKPGAEQQAVDALSRMKIISPHEPDEVDHITTIDADTARDTVERFHTELGHTSKTPIRRALTNEIQANPDIDWEQLLEQVLGDCKACQLYKAGHQTIQPLHPLPKVEAFQRWHIDYVGPLPKTAQGNEYLLTAIDSCTSLAFAIPLPDRRGANAVKLIETIISLFGKPDTLCSDNEFVLRGSLPIVCERMGIRQLHTTVSHPQTNGKVERFNRALTDILALFTAPPKIPEDWDKLLAAAVLAHNAKPMFHGYSPGFLAFGKQPTITQSTIGKHHSPTDRRGTGQFVIQKIKPRTRFIEIPS